MKHIIVTGGTGFIGSWLIEDMLQEGIKVTALVREASKLLPHLKEHFDLTIVECDYDDLENTIIDHEIDYDAFYHLGWGGVGSGDVLGGGYNPKNDIRLQLKNIANSLSAMKLAKKINCKKFIGAGTVAEYVFCEDIMDVNAKQTPNDMYGAAKVSSHYFLQVLSNQIDMPFIWAVIPSTFGERRTDNNIISYTIKSLLQGKKPLYGDLNQMWDFLYVSEVVRALRLIGEKGIDGKTYGIGSGVYKPLKDYIKMIRDEIDKNLELGIGVLNNMSQKTTSSCVNTYELIKDTGFVPRISFEEGIRKTIVYFQKYD